MKWIWVAWLLIPTALQAHELDTSHFARIPVLQDGRIKPMDSAARVLLREMRGEGAGASATRWLAQALFTPAETLEQKTFAVRSALLAERLGLHGAGTYSFAELAEPLGRNEIWLRSLAGKSDLGAEEREAAQLYNAMNDFTEVIGSFSLLLPLAGIDAPSRKALGLPQSGDLTYLDLIHARAQLKPRSPLALRLDLIEAADKKNALLRVIPPLWQGSGEWLSPWAVIEKGEGSPQGRELFRLWQKLAVAYRAHDTAAWDAASAELEARGDNAPDVRPAALELEVAYNISNPLGMGCALYAIGLLLVIAARFRPAARLREISFLVMIVGASLHAMAIAARMFILMRPPVGTLYESMIFVSLVAMLIALIMERKAKTGDALILGAPVAILLLLAATIFGGEGDTLGVLVAVLNTNFWLATHVVCITAGYGASLMAGTLAHLYLVRRIGGGEHAMLARRIHSVALVALLFTSVGTMLGGIWADQSWGRFWGWDPKENGALLIVLWLIWLLHARVANQLSEKGFALGMAGMNIVVALAWVGVNLLGVGLHSYGFTNEAAQGLIAFCALEAAFIFASGLILWRQERRAHAH